MKVAMLASTGSACGIAAYTRDLMAGLEGLVEVELESIEVGKQSEEHYRAQADRLNSADVIHIQHEHSFWGGILPNQSAFWVLRYLIKKPLVITAHTTYSLAELLRVRDERRPIHRIAKEVLIRRSGYRDSVDIAPFVTSRCIVHTEAARQALIERGAKPQYVHTIPAGVPEPIPAPTAGTAFRRQFGLENRRIVSLFGFIAPNKGYELCFDALPALPGDVSIVIAGGARTEDMKPYEAALKQRIQTAELAGRLVITGYLSDEMVAEAMAASEVVVTPHTQATGSYSVMVPLSYGRPVLASDLDVFREITERGSCLELFKSGDVEQFTARLNQLLNDGERRECLSSRALEYSKSHSWPEIARRTVEIYKEAIEDETRLAHHLPA